MRRRAETKKTLESPLDCKEIQPVHPKGDQSGVFIGRSDVEAETPVLWPPHVKSWLIGKDSDAGRDWGQEKGTTEDEMAGWHHWFNGCESEWTLGVGDGQGSLACCNSWGRKETWLSDWTELNWIDVLYQPGFLSDYMEQRSSPSALPKYTGYIAWRRDECLLIEATESWKLSIMVP